jgi:hypothetical protein
MFRLDHHCPWWSGAPGGQGVTAAVEDPPLARIRLWWGVFRAQAAHGAYAVTISNGLRDHTRAMPRPIANIVPACLCDVRYGVSNLQSHSSHAVAYGMTSMSESIAELGIG